MERGEISRSQLSPERLAYWYFRLNGFLTIENFIVHPETGGIAQTEADILATRFAFREENAIRPMVDDLLITECTTFANIIIAETTRRQCKLNGPWTSPERGNMVRVLRAIGCLENHDILEAATALYETGNWSNDIVTLRLFALGEWKDENLPIGLDQQIVWSSVIRFCVRRFTEYRDQKAYHPQWSHDGADLRSLSLERNESGIRELFGLRPI